MSQRISINGVDDGDVEDGNGGDDDGVTERREDENSFKRKRKRRLFLDGHNYKKGLKRAKKVVLFPFNKFQKLFKTDTTRSSSPCSSNSSLPNNNNNNNNNTWVGSYCCCLCMSKEPQTVDISSDDIDPNDPRISYFYVKTLLEQNEFYSKECNTHFVD